MIGRRDGVTIMRGARRWMALLKEFPHPFAWAAFGLTGVGR
jgi:hypothetical protein